MSIEQKIQQHIDKGNTEFTITHEVGKLNQFIADINRALGQMGYSENYNLAIRGKEVTIKIGRSRNE